MERMIIDITLGNPKSLKFDEDESRMWDKLVKNVADIKAKKGGIVDISPEVASHPGTVRGALRSDEFF